MQGSILVCQAYSEALCRKISSAFLSSLLRSATSMGRLHRAKEGERELEKERKKKKKKERQSERESHTHRERDNNLQGEQTHCSYAVTASYCSSTQFPSRPPPSSSPPLPFSLRSATCWKSRHSSSNACWHKRHGARWLTNCLRKSGSPAGFSDPRAN